MNFGIKDQIKGHMLVDVNNPLTLWEISIGRVISACDLELKGAVSQWHYWKIRNAVNSKNWKVYEREIELEEIRAKIFPNCVSRLTGVFLFESEQDLISARKYWRWTEAKYKYTEVGFSAKRWSRHDAQWLIDPNEPISNFGYRYWSGEAKDGKPVWELICSGLGMVWSDKVREIAYKRTFRRFKEASAFLYGSTLLFASKKEQAGLMIPYLAKNKDGLSGEIILKDQELREFDATNVDKISKEVCLPIHAEALESPKAPDLSEFFFTCSIPKL